MRKVSLFLFVFLFANFFLVQNIQAFSFRRNTSFAGKIQSLKAKEIESLEGEGYQCEIPGTTIEVKLLSSIKHTNETSYFIPSGLRPSSRGQTIRDQKSILGAYKSRTDISCKKCDEDGDCKITTVSLPTIERGFGISGKN